MIEALDTLFRGAAIAAFLMTLILLAPRAEGWGPRAAVTALSLCMIAYVVESSPHFALDCGPACAAVRVLPVFNPFLLWWVAIAFFDDAFRPRLAHLALLIPIIAPLFAPEVGPLRAAAVGLLYLHIIWTAVSTAADDLVPARIAFRRVFFVAAGAVGLAVLGVEVAYGRTAPPIWALSLQAAALAVLANSFLLWALKPRADFWPEAAPAAQPSALAHPADAALLARLQAAMEAGVWRTEGLTIGALASQLQTPEHRLRRVINRELGHRNFSAFINQRRIEAAQAALRDPARAEDAILSIAYEVGFSSLGPFNRAFRAETGQSPSDFAAAGLADPEKHAPILNITRRFSGSARAQRPLRLTSAASQLWRRDMTTQSALCAFLDHFPNTLSFDLCRYVLGAGGVFFLINWAAEVRLAHRKIRPDSPSAEQMGREILASLRTVLIFALIGTMIAIGAGVGVFRVYADPLARGWVWLLISTIILIVAHDAWFYWSHRLMHRPPLFRLLHRLHHRSHNPSPFASYSFDVGEAVVNAIFLPLILLVLPAHPIALIVFTGHMMLRNALGHCGYEVFPARKDGRPLFGWLTTVTHHDLHHAEAGWNLGLYFTWWDRWMGTEHPHYLSRFARAAGAKDASFA